MLKVLAALVKKSAWYKKSKQNQLKQKPLFPKRKREHERFKCYLLQTFRRRKCNSIFPTSVIEVGVPLQNLKICIGC